MKTTIDIPDGVLEETISHTHGSTKREAVLIALEEYSRRQRIEKLIAKAGQSDTFMTFEELMADREADKNRFYE